MFLTGSTFQGNCFFCICNNWQISLLNSVRAKAYFHWNEYLRNEFCFSGKFSSLSVLLFCSPCESFHIKYMWVPHILLYLQCHLTEPYIGVSAVLFLKLCWSVLVHECVSQTEPSHHLGSVSSRISEILVEIETTLYFLLKFFIFYWFCWNNSLFSFDVIQFVHPTHLWYSNLFIPQDSIKMSPI